MHKKRNTILVILSLIFICVVGAFELANNTLSGKKETCTIESAKFVNDYNAGAPTSEVDVQTTDCGKIIVTKVKSPVGVNEAKLAEVLNQHVGERFEFVLHPLQISSKGLASYGVTSLDPVK